MHQTPDMTGTTPVRSARSPLDRGLVADLAARILVAAGVRAAFGVPGGEVLRLIEALGREGVPFHAARHENAAGFMAVGGVRAGQALGLVVATLGPGVANVVGVAAHALQDDVPLIILGGRVALDSPAEFRHQVIDQVALFRPITKASFCLRVENAAAILHEATSLALSEPRGPVYIDCPQDVVEALAPADDAAVAAGTRSACAVKADASSIESSAQERLVAAIGCSRRPLILAGLGALRPGVARGLAGFITGCPMPVLTTYKAKGILAESHELALGGAGLSPRADDLLLPFVAAADLVLLLGYDPIEMRSNWNRPFAPEASVFSLGPAAARRAGPAVAESNAIEGDLAELLGRLGEDSPSRPLASEYRHDIEMLRRDLSRSFAPREAWEPARLFAALRRRIADDDIVTVDTGAHRILMAQTWRAEIPERLLQSSGFCTMACALPMAIGAKLAGPERRVLAVVGDGGLEMGAGELATLRDSGLPVTVIVIDDSGYALIDLKQRARGFPSAGVDLGGSDFARLAEAFGGQGRLVRNEAEFEVALDDAERASTFTLVHVPFPRRSYDGRI